MRRPSDGGIQVGLQAKVCHGTVPIAFRFVLKAVVLPHDGLANNEVVGGPMAWTIGKIIKQCTIESKVKGTYFYFYSVMGIKSTKHNDASLPLLTCSSSFLINAASSQRSTRFGRHLLTAAFSYATAAGTVTRVAATFLFLSSPPPPPPSSCLSSSSPPTASSPLFVRLCLLAAFSSVLDFPRCRRLAFRVHDQLVSSLSSVAAAAARHSSTTTRPKFRFKFCLKLFLICGDSRIGVYPGSVSPGDHGKNVFTRGVQSVLLLFQFLLRVLRLRLLSPGLYPVSLASHTSSRSSSTSRTIRITRKHEKHSPLFSFRRYLFANESSRARTMGSGRAVDTH